MKPWEIGKLNASPGAETISGIWLYLDDDHPVAAIDDHAPGGAEAWAKMFQAAPKMVQALLLNGARGPFGWHTLDCLSLPVDLPCTTACVATRAALEAVGVPLP